MAVAALLLAPAVAGADTFTVNDTGDGGDLTTNATCETASGNGRCTLRAAIEEANAQAGGDVIGFDPTIAGCSSGFDDCTIDVLNATGNGELDPLTGEVAIDGCSSDPDHPGPCVEVEMESLTTGSADSRALNVSGTADDTRISGLAITHAAVGIDYKDGATGLEVANDWFGVDLDGVTPNPDTRGLFLVGDGATVGGTAGATGTSPATRNVFAHATVAAITMWQDGDSNQVAGNYIGTLPDGVTPAPNGDGVHAATPSASPSRPDGNTIGGGRSSATAATCDGGCNVIAASSGDGIDLDGAPGESPAGATMVLGNFIGLDATGAFSAATANQTGIRVGDAGGVEIGSAIGDPVGRNYIADGPGGAGISHGQGPDLRLMYNSVGLAPSGAVASGAGGTGISLGGTAAAGDGAVLTGNRVAQDPAGVSVAIDGANSVLTGNIIGLASSADSAGADGLLVSEDGDDNRIGEPLGASNVIGSATGAGIRIEGGDGNAIRRSLIGVGSGGADRGNGGPGIQLADGADGADGNTIGAPAPTDSAFQENQISHNDGDAIEVTGAGSGNLIARNHGFDNGSAPDDLFIDLGPDGPGNVGGPNGGVRMPVISSATTEAATGAGGAADPGAVVRVFRIQTPGAGRIDEYVGETTASAATGSWTLDYSSHPLPAGQLIAVTQTLGQGTSELADPVQYDDVTPPRLEMSREIRQRVLVRRGVVVFGRCLTEPCPIARATGRVVLNGRALRFGSVTRSLPKGGLRSFKLPMSRGLREALARAFGHRPYPRATITLAVEDAAGNGSLARRKVTLKP